MKETIERVRTLVTSDFSTMATVRVNFGVGKETVEGGKKHLVATCIKICPNINVNATKENPYISIKSNPPILNYHTLFL